MVTMNAMPKVENLCPVCGYEMQEPPSDYNICPSCGTEFGLHDLNASIPELRSAWIETGPVWWSTTEEKPADWNPFSQLALLGQSSVRMIPSIVIVMSSSTLSTLEKVNEHWGFDWGAQAWGLLASKPLAGVYWSSPAREAVPQTNIGPAPVLGTLLGQ
jgi:hypothetical protein